MFSTSFFSDMEPERNEKHAFKRTIRLSKDHLKYSLMKKGGKCNKWKANTLTSYGGQWIDLCLFLPSHLMCLFPSFTHSLTDSHTTHTGLCWLWDIFMAVVELFFLFFLCTEKRPCCSCVWFRKKLHRRGAQPLQGQSAAGPTTAQGSPKTQGRH